SSEEIGCQAQATLHAAVEGAQIVLLEGVAQAEHGHLVAHLAEGAERLATNALGRRLRRHQLRVLSLQSLQLAEQPIVLCVWHTRLVQHGVAVVVLIQLGAERGDTWGSFCHGACVLENDKSSLGCSWDYMRWSA